MKMSPKSLSIPSLAVGLLAGTVLVTACPIAAEEGLEWLDSDSSAQDELGPDEPSRVKTDEPGPSYSLNRSLLASEDSTQWVGGRSAYTTNVPGPLVLTSLLSNETTIEVWVTDAPDCTPPPPDETFEVSAEMALGGTPLRVSSSERLCILGGVIGFPEEYTWSGYVPYY